MAGKSAKKHATNNTRILNQSIYISVAMVVLPFLRLLASNQYSKSLYFKFSMVQSPLIVCLFILNKTGRPIWIDGDLQNHGSMIDLTNPQGLVEYMLDIMYLSWAGDISISVFNSFKLVWFIWGLLIPTYIVYKLYGLKRQYFNNVKLPRQNNKDNIKPVESQSKSKRQLKREQNSEKVKYRTR